MQWMLLYRLDIAGFAVAAILAAILIEMRHSGRSTGDSRWSFWVATLGTVLLAAVLAEWTGQSEKQQLINSVSGLAPTYAEELTHLGHESITLQTSASDPRYLSMIASEKRWLALNPAVHDIYTFRINADHSMHLVVDSETDYDHNGLFEGEREMRTPIGETFDPGDDRVSQVWTTGEPAFSDQPVTDRWGSWVSSYAPLRGADGRVEAICGVDYDANRWVHAVLRARLLPIVLATALLAAVMGNNVMLRRIRREMHKRKLAEDDREKLNRALLETTRQAGMAEVATNVLHNVGNILNSVNMSAHLAIDHVRSSKVPNLGKAAALLSDNQGNLATFFTTDPRGQALPRYLNTLAQTLQGECESVLGELRSLSTGIEHIKHVVRAQQSMASRSTVLELTRPAALVDDSINLNMISLERHQVEIIRDYADLPAAMLDRHKLMQVLVNLIANAKDAVKDCPNPIKRITLRVRGTATETRFEVEDTGSGVAPEHLPKIFTHGFTTKATGHGFGLHYSANAMKEMGGAIQLTSDGPGKGAKIVLTLPIVQQSATATDAEAVAA